MPLIDLTEANFDLETERHGLVIVNFWAPWCGPCGAFAPTYAAAAERHPDVLFGRIDTEAETTLAKQFEIFSVPLLITSKAGTIVSAKPGALTDIKLEQLVQDLRRA